MPGPAARPQSLWWADDAAALPALEADLDADVLVIGGGIAGLTLALTLAEQDCVVALLEAGQLANGASGRNAGFLTVAPAEPYPEQIALWGRSHARAMLEVGRRSHRRVRQLVETLGIDCEYRTRGSVRLAVTDEEADDFRAGLESLRMDGFPMDERPVAEDAPPGSAARFSAAFFTPEDGEVHPVKLLRGLAQAATQRGARLFERTRVEEASWRAGLWEARTGGGVARARTLVLATNAYASGLCAALAPLIVPRRGQMLATAPIAREIAPAPTSAHYGYRYWRQTPEGRLVIGGWRDLDPDVEVGFDTEPTPRIQTALEEAVRDLVPEGIAITHRWAGTMGFARDGRPLVGWLDASHHLALCAGFTGHGMSMAAACTQDLADLLSWKRAPGITTFDPGRFPELRDVREHVTALGAAAGA